MYLVSPECILISRITTLTAYLLVWTKAMFGRYHCIGTTIIEMITVAKQFFETR